MPLSWRGHDSARESLKKVTVFYHKVKIVENFCLEEKVGCFCYFYSLFQGEFMSTTFSEHEDVSLPSHDAELHDAELHDAELYDV